MSQAIEIADYDEARLLVVAIEAERVRRRRQRAIWGLFPDDGPFARERYSKHLEFFGAGATHRQRLFLAGNRVGKTKGACYEIALHATGLYDEIAPWWEGRRFDRPVRIWVCGSSDEKVRETVQEELLGPVGQWGSGLLPGEKILKIERAASPIKDLIDIVRIKHKSGGASVLAFKSYKQGRTGFEGTAQDVIYGDEEMPADIHTECLLRTTDTTGTGQDNGLILLTFTPLQGLSPTVLDYLPTGELPVGPQEGPKYVVNATWDDVPHLDEATKTELRASIPAFQLDARTRGLPVLGPGVVYPVPELDYLVEPFALPPHWRRVYGLDVGWNRTAAVHGAYNPEADTWYLYHEYSRGQAEPSVHAAGIKAAGEWIPGVIDPASRGRGQADGQRLIDTYEALGLHLTPALNAVESGIYEVWERLSTGRLKIFTSLAHWRRECRLYLRDDKGRVIKKDDHLMDATRYLILSGGGVAKPQTPQVAPRSLPDDLGGVGRGSATAWMR